MRIYEKGEFYNLVWEQDGLIIQWKTREIKGYIANFQVKDIENDGEEELIVAVAPPAGEIGITSQKMRSNILFFKLF